MKQTQEQLEEVTRDRDELKQQLETLTTDLALVQAERDRTLAELAKLKENPPPATEQPTIDLSEQMPEIINFLKQFLPPDTKWPKRTIPELRKYLESKEG